MYCINCGSQIPDDAMFCHKCGYAVNEESNENIEEKVEQKVEKKPFEFGKISRVLKKILIVIAAVVVIVIGYNYAIENVIVAKVPDPEEFFGLEAEEKDLSYGIEMFFESESNPMPIIKEYVQALENSGQDIRVDYEKDANGYADYEIVYTGLWLGENRPKIRISYYGKYYYGEQHDKYGFKFDADFNFEVAESDDFTSDEFGESTEDTESE